MKKFVALLLACLMVVGMLAGCGSSKSKNTALKIGLSGPMTGGASEYGLAVRGGMEIAVAEINAKGGLQIEFKSEDDEADGSDKAVSAYNSLKDWGMQIMAGPVTTGSSLAIAAETVNDQIFKDNAWVDVDFEAAVQTTAKQGKVIASYQPIKALQDPKYYSHFTIAKVLPNGTLQTLNFERGGNVDMGLGDTWSGLLKKPLSMDEGNYMLVTGTRMANGSVLAEIEFFNVEADKTTPILKE